MNCVNAAISKFIMRVLCSQCILPEAEVNVTVILLASALPERNVNAAHICQNPKFSVTRIAVWSSDMDAATLECT